MAKIIVKCDKCGDGKFKYTVCKCSKPRPEKEKRYKIPCQFCKEIQGRDWKLDKITCHKCKGVFRRENSKRRWRGKKTLKFTIDNYKKLVLYSSALPN